MDSGEFDEDWSIPDEEEKPEKLFVKMVEVTNQKISHNLIDGLYLHGGDILAFLERDVETAEEQGDFETEKIYQMLIDRIRQMIMGRSAYDPL